jgi:hypothetical protein
VVVPPPFGCFVAPVENRVARHPATALHAGQDHGELGLDVGKEKPMSGYAAMLFAMVVLVLESATAFAAQPVLGRSFVLTDPQPNVAADRRSIVVYGRESATDDTLKGDPIASGASVQVFANGANSTTQTYSLPAGAYSGAGWGWRPIGNPAIGYVYRDPRGVQGPVTEAIVERAPNNTFTIKVTIKGSVGPGPQPHIVVVPPSPGTDGGMRFTINGASGDTYCVYFGGAAGGQVTNAPIASDPDKTFRIVSSARFPTSETSCRQVLGISGRSLTVDGVPTFLKGHGYGHLELALATDAADDASRGARIVRIPVRMLGLYNGPTTDGYQAQSPGNLDPAYLQMVVNRVTEAKAAGLFVDLFVDTNCGQKEHTPGDGDYEYCTFGGQPGGNFWSPDGQFYRDTVTSTWVYLATLLRGMIDIHELGPEEAPPSGSVADVKSVYTQFRNAILAVVPEAVFLAGPYSYDVDKIDTIYDPTWASNTIWTANLLKGATQSGDPPGSNLAARIATLTSFVDANNAPVFIQQLGTESSVDTDDSLLDTALTAVEAPSAMLAGYTSWEKVSVFSGSYGEAYLPSQNADPATRIYKANRRAVFTAHFQGP